MKDALLAFSYLWKRIIQVTWMVNKELSKLLIFFAGLRFATSEPTGTELYSTVFDGRVL